MQQILGVEIKSLSRVNSLLMRYFTRPQKGYAYRQNLSTHRFVERSANGTQHS